MMNKAAANNASAVPAARSMNATLKHDNPFLVDGVAQPNAFIHSEKFIQTVTSSLVWRFNWWR